jgi:hypothetical protein
MIDAVVVWIADGAPVPSDDAKRSLEAWARARGVKLVAPSEDAEPAKGIDWSAGEDVESAIARAREALAGLDFAATEKALGEAEATLRDHAELPHAAWLRAEIERTWSSRWLRAKDEARAKLAWQRAAALDGGRAPGLGEKAFDAGATITATIRLDGVGDGEAALRLDGSPIAPGDVTRGEGEHALGVVRADGSIVSSAWVPLTQGAVVRAQAPVAPSCAVGDVKRARLAGDAIVAKGVRCGHWVAAIAVDAEVIRVASCEADSCGPLVEWRVTSSPSWTFAPPTTLPGSGAAADSGAHWPAWATWTIAGVGVAGATIAIIAAAGAFKSAPTETHFVNGGLQIHSF